MAVLPVPYQLAPGLPALYPRGESNSTWIAGVAAYDQYTQVEPAQGSWTDVTYFLRRSGDGELYRLGGESAWTHVFDRVGVFSPSRWMALAAEVRLDMPSREAHAQYELIGMIARDIVLWANGDSVMLVRDGLGFQGGLVTGSRFRVSTQAIPVL